MTKRFYNGREIPEGLYKQQRSKYWWTKIKGNRESTETENFTEAVRILDIRKGKIAEGRKITPQTIRFDDIAQGFITDYKINEKKSIDKAQRSVRHLKDYFKNMKVKDITASKVKKYIEQRKEKGKASNGEINRETAALKRMFNLAIHDEIIFSKPYIPKLDENNVRQGFFEDDAFRAVLKELPEPIKPIVLCGYYIGWRREEITKLTWGQIDLAEKTARLEVGTTKNKEGRLIFFPDELWDAIREQRALTSELERKQGRIIPWLFHREGNQVKDFREVWNNACSKAGYGRRYFHDFRRTAYRNMLRRGIPEKVVMDIIGHKTRSMSDRYNITSVKDLKEASRTMSGIPEGIPEPKERRNQEG